MSSVVDPTHENEPRADQPAPRWVFVGGTGRSGTTVTARAIARSGPLTLAPIELRFHVDRGGLTDLASGETSLERFQEAVLGPWFERQTAGGIRGIHQLVDRTALEKVFDDLPQGDPRTLARELWTRIATAMFGPGRLVEMTPANMARADDLSRMLSHRVALVNVVRDGRDVAFSVQCKAWGPNDPITALHWWANRVRKADKARRYGAPMLSVPLEELAAPETQSHWAKQLAAHVGGVAPAGVQTGMLEFRQKAVQAGKWRESVSAEVAAQVDRTYERLWHELADEGVVGLPRLPQDQESVHGASR